jgi:hypothetical protein
MRRFKLAVFLGLFVFLILPTIAFPLWAQITQPESAATQPAADLAVRVVAIGGMVAAIVQGIKKMFPAIGGIVAIILNVVGALGATYAAAPAGTEILSISFLMQSALSAFMAHGAHALVTAGRKTPG